MNNAETYKTLQTLDSKLDAARKAARKFARGMAGPDTEDAEQIAAVAVLQAVVKGREGTFSYWYTLATRRLFDYARGEKRRRAREYEYTARLYGHDAVASDVHTNPDVHAEE